MSTQLLPGPKQRLLLEAALEVLHDESQEWLNDIAFWRDEVAFYHHLLKEVFGAHALATARAEAMNLERELIRISVEELETLNTNVIDHERYLAAVTMGRAVNNERTYRARHAVIAQHMRDFDFRFRELKKYIFRFTSKQHFGRK